MSTPNPDYDPNWEIKWRAAKFRVDAVGRQDNIDDMFSGLNKKYKTLEDLHEVVFDRLRRQFPDEDISDELVACAGAQTPDDIYAKAQHAREILKRRQWEVGVRGREHHYQPDDLMAFADPASPDCERLIHRVRWGGPYGRRMGVSETVVVRELYATEAHVCLLSAPSVVRGSHPSEEDTQGRVQLPSVYFTAELSDRYSPGQVVWYHYLAGGDGVEHAWFFRRANLKWQPSRTEGFFRRKDIAGDWFVRTESSSNDRHFRSVPRVIGEAVLLDQGHELPIVELPDLRYY